jgi:transposase-like protein
MEKLKKCPECGSSWDGGSIVEKLHEQEPWKTKEEIEITVKQYYSPPYRFSRLIGVEDAQKYDGISYWKCPDCGTMWNRFTGEKTS